MEDRMLASNCTHCCVPPSFRIGPNRNPGEMFDRAKIHISCHPVTQKDASNASIWTAVTLRCQLIRQPRTKLNFSIIDFPQQADQITERNFYKKFEQVLSVLLKQCSCNALVCLWAELQSIQLGLSSGLSPIILVYTILFVIILKYSLSITSNMVKAFILVLRAQRKTKVFVKDIKQLCVAPRRRIPPLPKYYSVQLQKYEQKIELSCSQNTEMQ